MIDGLYHTERKYKGKDIVIDISQEHSAFGDCFEVMVLYNRSGEELSSEICHELSDAIGVYNAMLEGFPDSPAPLTGKYAKLHDDLQKALIAGRTAEDNNPEDGGTCNFDSASIFLPRWNTAKVEQAAKEAGTGCFVWKLLGPRRFVFSPNARGQGNARTRNAKAMTAALREMGYDAAEFYQID